MCDVCLDHDEDDSKEEQYDVDDDSEEVEDAIPENMESEGNKTEMITNGGNDVPLDTGVNGTPINEVGNGECMRYQGQRGTSQKCRDKRFNPLE